MTPGVVLVLLLPVLLDCKRSELSFIFYFLSPLQITGCPACPGSLEMHIFQCHLTLQCTYQSCFSNSKEHIQLPIHYQDQTVIFC